MLKNQSKKYQISKSGQQCLGKCYEVGKKFKHPVSGNVVMNDYLKGLPICPTFEYTTKSDDGKKNILDYDECNKPEKTTAIEEYNNAFRIEFSKRLFLSTYYGIYSFNDAITWDEDNESSVNFRTRERIYNCAICEYGDNLEFYNSRFVKFMQSYMENNIRTIYNDIHEYIDIDNDIVKISKEKTKLEKQNFNVERINYILYEIITKDVMQKFLFYVLNEKIIDFSDYNDSLYALLLEFIKYIHKNIIKL